MYLLYSILYFSALIFLLPFEYIKRPKGLRNRWLRERFGRYSTEAQKLGSEEVKTSELKTIWFHAVSVGEVIAAVPLIKKINEKYPAAEVVVSTVTDTGQKVAKERIGDIARIIYIPFDLPFAISGAVRRIEPSLFIIMETELWPNTVRILSRRGIPVLLMNGRISERSFGGYKRIGFFIKDVLRNVSIFCMQNEIYAERIKKLGAEPDKINIIGNFKFDTKPQSIIPEWTEIFRRQRTEDIRQTGEREFVLIAGSTHRKEEDLIIDAYIKLKSDYPRLNLIIAPRHPERFREVEELLRKKGLKYIRRSDITVQGSQVMGVVVLLDVIGELSSVYGACDVAIMGGSFIRHGGQNPIEPACWGKAIICGPHMENFPFIEDFYRTGGAIRADSDNLYRVLKGLLDSPEKISSMGEIAKNLYEKNSGATDRALEIIERYL